MNDPTSEKAAALDPVAEAILETLAASDKPAISAETVCQAIQKSRARPGDGPQAWRKYMRAVKQQALHLARGGRIEIVRKGKPVDPDDFKGVWRMRLPGGGAGTG